MKTLFFHVNQLKFYQWSFLEIFLSWLLIYVIPRFEKSNLLYNLFVKMFQQFLYNLPYTLGFWARILFVKSIFGGKMFFKDDFILSCALLRLSFLKPNCVFKRIISNGSQILFSTDKKFSYGYGCIKAMVWLACLKFWWFTVKRKVCCMQHNDCVHTQPPIHAHIQHYNQIMRYLLTLYHPFSVFDVDRGLRFSTHELYYNHTVSYLIW